MSLPILPTETRLSWGYTEAQMQAHYEKGRAAALEEAAIDAERNGHLWSGKPAKAFFELAEKIRSLK